MKYSPMNSEYKRRWLEALRSKKYIQAHGKLRVSMGDSKKRMCCLGVLCDLVNPKEWERDFDGYTFRGERGLPDNTVLKETGLTSRKAEKLANLNDDKGYDFKEIAEFVEKNF